MLLPLSWLNDFVKIDDIPVESLKNDMFSCGFEVEDIIYKNSDVKNIVVCQINAVEQHPNADKLSVCSVNAGKFGELQIVTNAKNIKVGDKVPVSLDGAVLADGTKIKKGKLRGVDSDGMFCGGAEIGITEEYYDGAGGDSVLVFKDDFPAGADVCELLHTKDVIFDVGVTANRPDCQSIFGLAREVAAVLNRKLKEPELDYETVNGGKPCPIEVKVDAPDLCPLYMAKYVKDIAVMPSPKWMQRRLALSGIRAINNIVDITNYVLIEMGQPMHAFDADALSGKIIVRRAVNGEKITTLDDKEFTLSDDNLVICAGDDKPTALAGIMGGKNSGIGDYTNNLIFECAKFKRDNIRKSSRTLGQRSDSSARFEKGVDAYSVKMALERALHLICRLKAGIVSYACAEVAAEIESDRIIQTSYDEIDRVLGIEVPAEIQKDILTRLRFIIKEKGNGKFSAIVPPYREDVEGAPDLAEEVIRIYGYDHIIGRLLNGAAVTDGGRNASQITEEKMKAAMVASGALETITYSFVSENDYVAFGLDKNAPENKHIVLFNPLGEDLSVMRTTLLPSMVASVARNISRKNTSGRLFEIAKVYIPKELPLTELPVEKRRLCLGFFGDKESFFTLKGVISQALKYVGFKNKLDYVKASAPYLHPGRSAKIYSDGVEIGIIGELHPELSEKLGMDGRVYVSELDYEYISDRSVTKTTYSAVSRFPAVERDLALVCDDCVDNEKITSLIFERGGKNLASVEIFDIYKGIGIAPGKKSMAYRLTFSSLEKTFGEGEVDGFIKKILFHLEENGIKLR